MPHHRNPFIYGRPVRGDEFLFREHELQTIFNRLRHSESTAVIGEPHTGKTSLLIQVARPEVQNKFFDTSDKKLHIQNIDLHSIESEYCPEDFWEEAVAPIESIELQPVKVLLRNAKSNDYSRRSLDKLFSYLDSQNHLLVLLLDEFERLLKHKNFSDPSFFGALRSLGTRTGGLALVIASRLDLATLNNLGRGLLDTGSPFFNNMIALKLSAFSYDEINHLLFLNEPRFSEEERFFIRRVAGGNPYLIQAFAATMFESLPSLKSTEIDIRSSEIDFKEAADIFYNRIDHYFADLWNCMDSSTRTVAVILSLKDLDGRALGSDFNYGEIENVDLFGPELYTLKRLGLAELISSKEKGWLVDSKRLWLWRGEQWGFSCAAFSCWVRDVIISTNRQVPSFDVWLKNQEYKNFLTRKQMDDLVTVAHKIPIGLVKGIGGLAFILIDEIRKHTGS